MMEGDSSYPNHVKAEIKRRGYKLSEVAKAVYISERTLYTYCIGKRPIPRDTLERLATLLECPISVLVEYPVPSPHEMLPSTTSKASPTGRKALPSLLAHTQDILREMQEDEEREEQDMDERRRRLARQMFNMTGAMVVTPTELLNFETLGRLIRALKKPSSVDDAVLTDLEMVTWNHRLRFVHSHESCLMLPDVSGHLQVITQLLEHSLPTYAYNRLCVLASETTRLIGDILFNAGASDTANTYYDVALITAKEVHNDALYAMTLGRKSFIPIHFGNACDALPLLQEAHSKGKRDAADIIDAYLWAIEAEAQANIGAVDDCLGALEQSEFLLDRGRSGIVPYGFAEATYTPFNAIQLIGYKGICYTRLKQPQKALEFLEQRLVSISPAQIHSKSIILTDFAMIYIQLGEIEEGCKYANQALAIIEQTRSASVYKRLFKLRCELEPWKDTLAVRTFDENLMLLTPRKIGPSSFLAGEER